MKASPVQRPKLSPAKLCALLLLAALPARSAELWPDLSSPRQGLGGGEKDAAVIVGLEHYAFVAQVPGARKNAEDWQAYLTGTLNVPAERVALLRDNDATIEDIRRYASEKASQVRSGGTLWFVFIGHGVPSKDGKDGLLVGADAQQKAESVYARSLSQGELLTLLAKGPQKRTVVIVDACFSGRSASGQAIVQGLQPLMLVNSQPAGADARTVLLTAAKSDQFAGPLPKANRPRPAFSYLALGALRGWAAGQDGKVTALAVVDFARRALSLDKGRTQTPELAIGAQDTILGRGHEKPPDLARIDREGGDDASKFQVKTLTELPRASAPSPVDFGSAPEVREVSRLNPPKGIDFDSIDFHALTRYDEAVKYEKSGASPADKEGKWLLLGKNIPAYAKVAEARALEWHAVATQDALSSALQFDKSSAAPEAKAAKWLGLASSYPEHSGVAVKRAGEWEKYAAALKSEADAKRAQVAVRDRDWEKLNSLLSLTVVSPEDKGKFAKEFADAYAKSPGLEPRMAKSLAEYMPAGPERTKIMTHSTLGKAGIEWVRIPGGSFNIAEDGKYGAPVRAWYRKAQLEGMESFLHKVTVADFEMAKSLVTNKQYRSCVAAGACTERSCAQESMKPLALRFNGISWNTTPEGDADQRPVDCISLKQARAFAKWVGGRLPTEVEWEYAARSLGKGQRYPWGNGEHGCGVRIKCQSGNEPVCAHPATNTEQGLCDMVGRFCQLTNDTSVLFRGLQETRGIREAQPGLQPCRGGETGQGVDVDSRVLIDPEVGAYEQSFRPVR